MDRQTWLDQRRAAVLASYDQEAPAYDDHGYPTQTQQDWVARLMRACPAAAKILDAPCGTGRYFPIVAAAGHRVLGADQSAAMLAQARARGIAVALDLVRLQELRACADPDHPSRRQPIQPLLPGRGAARAAPLAAGDCLAHLVMPHPIRAWRRSSPRPAGRAIYVSVRVGRRVW